MTYLHESNTAITDPIKDINYLPLRNPLIFFCSCCFPLETLIFRQTNFIRIVSCFCFSPSDFSLTFYLFSRSFIHFFTKFHFYVFWSLLSMAFFASSTSTIFRDFLISAFRSLLSGFFSPALAFWTICSLSLLITSSAISSISVASVTRQSLCSSAY